MEATAQHRVAQEVQEEQPHKAAGAAKAAGYSAAGKAASWPPRPGPVIRAQEARGAHPATGAGVVLVEMPRAMATGPTEGQVERPRMVVPGGRGAWRAV